MFHGQIQLCQHREGYRYSVDAVLLAHFASRHRPSSALDLGTGCGVIPLLLAHLWEHRTGELPAMVGLELQPSLAALARDNVERNQRQDVIAIVEADIRSWSPPEPLRLLTFNPPYFPENSGKLSPNRERASARHECHGSLDVLVAAGASWLHSRGHLAMVYPAEGLNKLHRALRRAQLHLTRLQLVHPHRAAPASLLLAAARRRATPLQIEAPLFLYQEPSGRRYTEEVEALLRGEPWDAFA